MHPPYWSPLTPLPKPPSFGQSPQSISPSHVHFTPHLTFSYQDKDWWRFGSGQIYFYMGVNWEEMEVAQKQGRLCLIGVHAPFGILASEFGWFSAVSNFSSQNGRCLPFLNNKDKDISPKIFLEFKILYISKIVN